MTNKPNEFQLLCIRVAKQLENIMEGPGGLHEVITLSTAHFRVAMMMLASCMGEEEFSKLFTKIIGAINEDIDAVRRKINQKVTK